jgi:hypothetical protein
MVVASVVSTIRQNPKSLGRRKRLPKDFFTFLFNPAQVAGEVLRLRADAVTAVPRSAHALPTSGSRSGPRLWGCLSSSVIIYHEKVGPRVTAGDGSSRAIRR